ncbi:alpha/beta fold hydrolase [Deinococcus cellulosilyticus]|uniref:AB hydrolase-1 domain-containing protein n=1 Tax=Deinococcus cellulosilyticus (strain DSM 18568 / NBRC 106333 / KACC 11606 / 5516J-15) TaxID=1223518 RepID=A0A511MZK4_DEIC1|nr:alpha/beta fold hydrolase [Deinococcus cellulosilyticus]GEM46055.1 hypothetical protein DC3_16900 [Deinococcus cellulosilyticus NBRC 106333 = KACC 11606]
MMSILWLHGWSFTPEVWKPLQDLLPEFTHHPISYQGCKTAQEMQQKVSDTIRDLAPDLVVAWSLGATLALGCPWIPRLVVVAGTLRFTDVWPERVLNQMIRQLHQDPERVLNAFRQHIGAPAPTRQELDAWPTDTLIAGLEVLRDTEQTLEPLPELLWIHGEKDPLVKPPAHLSRTDIPEAGHLPMLTHPEMLASLIMRFR